MAERIPKLNFDQDRKGEWRWRFLHGNGKILDASKQGFKRRAGARRNWLRLVDAVIEWTQQ